MAKTETIYVSLTQDLESVLSDLRAGKYPQRLIKGILHALESKRMPTHATLRDMELLSNIFACLNDPSNKKLQVRDATLSKIYDHVESSYNQTLSQEFGLPIYSLEGYLGLKRTGNFEKLQASKEALLRGEDQIALIRSYGDGNCGLRSIIQGVLLQGILQNKQREAIGLIASWVNKHKEFYSDLFSSAEWVGFIKDYLAVDTSNISEFMAYYFPMDLHDKDKKPLGDNVLYFLAACLRRDMALSYHPELQMKLSDANPSFMELDKEIDFGYIGAYLQTQSIALDTLKYCEGKINGISHFDKLESIAFGEQKKDPAFRLGILWKMPHFDVVVRQSDALAFKESSANTATRSAQKSESGHPRGSDAVARSSRRETPVVDKTNPGAVQKRILVKCEFDRNDTDAPQAAFDTLYKNLQGRYLFLGETYLYYDPSQNSVYISSEDIGNARLGLFHLKENAHLPFSVSEQQQTSKLNVDDMQEYRVDSKIGKLILISDNPPTPHLDADTAERINDESLEPPRQDRAIRKSHINDDEAFDKSELDIVVNKHESEDKGAALYPVDSMSRWEEIIEFIATDDQTVLSEYQSTLTPHEGAVVNHYVADLLNELIAQGVDTSFINELKKFLDSLSHIFDESHKLYIEKQNLPDTHFLLCKECPPKKISENTVYFYPYQGSFACKYKVDGEAIEEVITTQEAVDLLRVKKQSLADDEAYTEIDYNDVLSRSISHSKKTGIDTDSVMHDVAREVASKIKSAIPAIKNKDRDQLTGLKRDVGDLLALKKDTSFHNTNEMHRLRQSLPRVIVCLKVFIGKIKSFFIKNKSLNFVPAQEALRRASQEWSKGPISRMARQYKFPKDLKNFKECKKVMRVCIQEPNPVKLKWAVDQWKKLLSRKHKMEGVGSVDKYTRLRQNLDERSFYRRYSTDQQVDECIEFPMKPGGNRGLDNGSLLTTACRNFDVLGVGVLLQDAGANARRRLYVDGNYVSPLENFLLDCKSLKDGFDNDPIKREAAVSIIKLLIAHGGLAVNENGFKEKISGYLRELQLDVVLPDQSNASANAFALGYHMQQSSHHENGVQQGAVLAMA